MKNYDHKAIEAKWQKRWEEDKFYETPDEIKGKDNFYTLVEFSYPSGNLHVGHWYAFAVTDIFARKKRMDGKNVMFPMGFDAFGLPAENAAIKNNLNPREWTYSNMEHMEKQLRSMGASFDWSRKVVTCDPDYYKWTQWLFLQFLKNGLAEQKETEVNWCPSCKTVLANEQVVNGHCERCDSEVEKRVMKQWSLKITDYAEKLLSGLDALDWPDQIKESQRNWIGKSEGSELSFKIKDSDDEINVFTTRADTLMGVTYVVLAPEHPLVDVYKNNAENESQITKYQKESQKKKDIERTAEGKEKTGVELKGIVVLHPVTGEELPVWVADYVLASYGTGAVMAVPAHDARDFEFAGKFDLPVNKVIETDGELPFVGVGELVNSEKFDGLNSEEAKEKITKAAKGEMKSTYKLRDWTVSRQRYWGCPIPVIHCDDCGAVPVPDADLPVVLPEVDDFLPNDEGKSPLSKATDWVNVKCSECGKDAKRETDTLDTFVDSSWYFLRYCDSKNDKDFADSKVLKQWMPVDFYSGGAEHTTMHLLYSRFFQKALNDFGLVENDEPFARRLNRGLIMGPDGNKMSKSKGNVIDPDDVVEKLGADTVRTYLAFIGPYNEAGSYPWDTDSIVGIRRFLERVTGLADKIGDGEADVVIDKHIKKVTEDCDALKFNTALASLMTLVNNIEKNDSVSEEQYKKLLLLLAPFAPHITEELWEKLGEKTSIHTAEWPTYDESKLVSDTAMIAVQVNGKVRDVIELETDISDSDAEKQALESDKVQKWIDGKKVKKVIVISGKVINVVI